MEKNENLTQQKHTFCDHNTSQLITWSSRHTVMSSQGQLVTHASRHSAMISSILSVGKFKAFNRSRYEFWTNLKLTLSLDSVLVHQHHFSFGIPYTISTFQV